MRQHTYLECTRVEVTFKFISSLNKTKTLVLAREVMAERVKKKKKAMTQKQSLEKKALRKL